MIKRRTNVEIIALGFALVILIGACLLLMPWASEQTDKRAAGRAKIVTDSGTEIVPFNQTLFDQMKATRGPVIDMIKQRIGAELPDLLIQEVDKATAEQNQNTK